MSCDSPLSFGEILAKDINPLNMEILSDDEEDRARAHWCEGFSHCESVGEAEFTLSSVGDILLEVWE